MASPVDINPNHLKIVHDILHRKLPSGVTTWVFGSRATWTTKDSSDLDLALECVAGSLDHRVMIELEVAFEESTIPYAVDVVDLNDISDRFKKIVEGQMIQLPTVDGQLM